MESTVEVRYAGVVVGRGATLRGKDAAGGFIVSADPMPVGTPLLLKGEDGDLRAEVVEVVESADLNVAGMRVRFAGTGSARAAAVASSPAPAFFPAAAPVAPAAPVAAAPEEAAPAPTVSVADAVPEATAPGAGDSSSTAHAEGDGSHGGGSGKRRRRRR